MNCKTLLMALIMIASPVSKGLAYELGKTTTGTSTGTSTSSSGSSTTGSCVGGYTAGKTSSGSGSTTSGCTTTPPGIDDDADGMISSYEMGYTIILDKYDALDAKEDADSDYITNLVEYLRGLTPDDDDTDGDGVKDGDDPEPTNPVRARFRLNTNFTGSSITENVRVE